MIVQEGERKLPKHIVNSVKVKKVTWLKNFLSSELMQKVILSGQIELPPKADKCRNLISLKTKHLDKARCDKF